MILPLDKYPKIDVHGETRDTIFTVVDSFIKDNIKLKNEIVIIVHGIGEGILKTEIHNILKKNNLVKNFHLHYWNQGVTIVELYVDKC